MVIANAAASVSKYGLASASQISYADLKGKTLVEVPNVFVKVGETEIAKGDGGTYPDDKGGVYVNISEKILGLDQPANTPVEVKLIQRTAAIMLQQFKILKSDGTEYDNVEITGLSLLNSKTIGQVAGEVSSGEQLYGVQSVNDSTERLYSYENTSSSQPTTLKIDYVYNNGEIGSCSFPIKSRLKETSDPSIAVWAGYLYKLEVTLRNAAVDVTVQCVTQDWIFDKDHEFEFTF